MLAILVFAALQAEQGPAVVASSQPPELRNPQAVIKPDDYPLEALRRGEYGIVSILLHVSAEGKVISCDITESSGSTTLDRKTCSLLKMRARFDPAKDEAGSALAGEFRSAFTWGVDEHQPRGTIDLALQTPNLPGDYRSPVKARLIFDSSGRVAACEITATSGSNTADRAACEYAKQQLAVTAPKSASDDVPAAAVRILTVSLSTQ